MFIIHCTLYFLDLQVNSVVLSSDQFDILVKIINSAVTDDRTAMALLPVSTIMYRVREREREREGVCVCVRERERECVCV